jgi:hypothetical protein
MDLQKLKRLNLRQPKYIFPLGHLPAPVGAYLLRHGDLQGQRQDRQERSHRLHQHEPPRSTQLRAWTTR